MTHILHFLAGRQKVLFRHRLPADFTGKCVASLDSCNIVAIFFYTTGLGVDLTVPVDGDNDAGGDGKYIYPAAAEGICHALHGIFHTVDLRTGYKHDLANIQNTCEDLIKFHLCLQKSGHIVNAGGLTDQEACGFHSTVCKHGPIVGLVAKGQGLIIGTDMHLVNTDHITHP